MSRKLSLDFEALSVESFATSAPGGGERGTVRGRESADPPEYFDCTCAASCDCPSAYYHCNTNPVATYSCNYTHNESCPVTKVCPPTS